MNLDIASMLSGVFSRKSIPFRLLIPQCFNMNHIDCQCSCMIINDIFHFSITRGYFRAEFTGLRSLSCIMHPGTNLRDNGLERSRFMTTLSKCDHLGIKNALEMKLNRNILHENDIKGSINTGD